MQFFVMLMLLSVGSAAYIPAVGVRRGCAASASIVMKKVDKEVAKEAAPADVMPEVDVEQAKESIKGFTSTPKVTPKAPKALKVEIPDVDVEDAVVEAMKISGKAATAASEAFSAAVEFEKENEVGAKAKDFFSSAVEFWKENEIGLKIQAVAEVATEEVSHTPCTFDRFDALAASFACQLFVKSTRIRPTTRRHPDSHSAHALCAPSQAKKVEMPKAKPMAKKTAKVEIIDSADEPVVKKGLKFKNPFSK